MRVMNSAPSMRDMPFDAWYECTCPFDLCVAGLIPCVTAVTTVVAHVISDLYLRHIGRGCEEK